MITHEDVEHMSLGELVIFYSEHPNFEFSASQRNAIDEYLRWSGPYFFAGGDDIIEAMRKEWHLLKQDDSGTLFRLPGGDIALIPPDQYFGFQVIPLSDFFNQNKDS